MRLLRLVSSILLLLGGSISLGHRFGTRQVGDGTPVELRSGAWIIKGDFEAAPGAGQGPAVLLLNKAAGNRTVYAPLASELAQRGISSLRIDLRGHGESINGGVFVPGSANSLELIQDSDADVRVALDWLRQRRSVDPRRIGLLGASYSGELAASTATQKETRVRAYVLLSPGSLSERSAKAIDSSHAHWLFIRAAREKSPSVRTAAELVQKYSHTAGVRVIDSDKHASDLLPDRPELNREIADWFERVLEVRK